METRFPEFDVWEAEAKVDAEVEKGRKQEFQKMIYEAGGDLKLVVEKMKATNASRQIGSLPHLHLPPRSPIVHRRRIESSERTRVGRNDPCPCGSGRKFKTCCMRK
jgi:uncharacterized protein YecA (UPF0149 family)